MASAAAICDRTGYDLVVLWVPDHHCDCRLSDVLDYPGAVLDDPVARDVLASTSHVYNYMEVEPGARFNQPILATPVSGDVYVRSAYSLVSPHHSFADEQRHLRSYVPAKAILDLLAQARRPNDVALHIRSATNEHLGCPSYESAENWPAERHAEIVEWRKHSTAQRFMARIDALIAEGKADTLFLAADLPQTYDAFADRYGDRLAWLRRDVFDRSARQIQFAMADLLLLTAAPRFLGSTWSSFSDVAQRLAVPGRRFEQSGKDF